MCWAQTSRTWSRDVLPQPMLRRSTLQCQQRTLFGALSAISRSTRMPRIPPHICSSWLVRTTCSLTPDLVLRRHVAANESVILCILTFLIKLELAMDDKLFDHFRASTDPKYIKSLKELFMDFNGTNNPLPFTRTFSMCYQAEPQLTFLVP